MLCACQRQRASGTLQRYFTLLYIFAANQHHNSVCAGAAALGSISQSCGIQQPSERLRQDVALSTGCRSKKLLQCLGRWNNLQARWHQRGRQPEMIRWWRAGRWREW